MYLDRRNKRILLKDGTSLMEPHDFAAFILENDEVPSSIKTERSKDTEAFLLLFGDDYGYDIETDYRLPVRMVLSPRKYKDTILEGIVNTLTDTHYTLDELTEEEKRVISCKESHGDQAVYDRCVAELEYFDNGVLFRAEMLVRRFRENGVIWGVGRGSMCSSLILYFLCLHDVDPLEYDIPFSELSKEVESKFS